MNVAPTILAALAALSLTACGPSLAKSGVQLAMSSAYRPDPGWRAAPAPAPEKLEAPRYQLLAGDLHCHVGPPDTASEVDRGVAETVQLAAAEGLDFVVLTPHVGERFFADPSYRAWVLSSRAKLRAELDRLSPRTTFVIGMEYTDHHHGHVGAAFADLEAVLADVPLPVAEAHPERFFESFVSHGGILVINHPLTTPLDSMFAIARADLSWRPFTARGPFPREIDAIDRLAHGLEAYNLTVTHLRDRFLLRDTDHSINATLALMDREIVSRNKRLFPAGGSDSHTHHLRITTFVWSRDRSEGAIREALAAGRVCVRGPEACSFEARAPGGAWAGLGGTVQGSAVEVRARGEDIEVYLDGSRVASPTSGAIARVALPEGRCAVLRAKVSEGYSAPIYANCPFASKE